MTIQSNFAEELGSKILHYNNETPEELILESVSLSMLSCFDELGQIIKVPIIDCRIILKDAIMASIRKIPHRMAVILENEKYVHVNDIIGISQDEKLDKLLQSLLHCAGGISEYDFFRKKTRKREIVWVRQIWTTVLTRLCKYSLAKAGATINRDHATCLNSAKRVDNLLEFDVEWQYIHYDAFVVIKRHFDAESKFELGWMKKYGN